MKHIYSMVCGGLFFLLMASYAPAHAQELMTQKETIPTPEMTVVAVEEKVEYVLPYPGMLPDHPLYNLKRVRDYILERLIADPVKKAEFYILQADKRLQMGIFLAAQGKNELAQSTISKGEKYLEKAEGILVALKANGTLPAYVLEKFDNSLGKHQEILNQLMVSSTEPLKTGLSESAALLSRLSAEVEQLKK